MELYDENQSLVDASGSAEDEERIAFRNDRGQQGWYYLRVMGYMNAQATYRLQISVSSGSTCRDDRLEPNNGPWNARDLADPSDYDNLTLCNGESDWYVIKTQPGQGLEVSYGVTSGDNPGISLAVYQSNWYQLVGEIGPQMNGSLSLASGSGDPVYYLRFNGAVGKDHGYRFTARSSAATCNDDSYEENDSPGQARNINRGTHPGLKVCPNDDDYYSIRLDSNYSLRVRIGFMYLDGDLGLEITDPSGAVHRSQTQADFESLTVNSVAGRYIIRVFGIQGAQNAYTMEVQAAKEPCAPCLNNSECGGLNPICFFMPPWDMGQKYCLPSCGSNDNCPRGFNCFTIPMLNEKYCVPNGMSCTP